MPFYYDVQVPDFADSSAKCLFVKWVQSEKSDIQAGTALAIVRSGGAEYLLRNAGPGFFTPWKIRQGDELASGQTIGRITTDGDLIPYGRPYVTFEQVTKEQQ